MRYFWSPFTSASLVAVGLVIGVIGDLKEVVQVEKDGEDNHQEYITPAPPHVMLEKLIWRGECIIRNV